MKSGFSEFSYGYALTEELIRNNRNTMVIAPVFPSVIDEAELGYDLYLGLKGLPLDTRHPMTERILLMSWASSLQEKIHVGK
jgi:hypothetical protein